MAVPHPRVEAPSSPADWTRHAPSHIARTVGEGTMRPYLTAAEVAQIELQLAGLASLLEFGCGEATIVAARQVRRIVSVDSDPARLRTVQEKVAREAVEFIPVHIDRKSTRLNSSH